MTAALAALLVAATGAGAASGSTGQAAEDTVLLTVEGTVQQVVVDDPHADAHDGLVLDTMVEVDGTVYDVPAAAETSLDSAEVRTGDEVELTVRADDGLTAGEALEAAQVVEGLPAGDPTAEILAVTAEPAVTAETRTAEAQVSILGTHTLTILPVFWGSRDGATQASLQRLAADASQYWAEQSGGRVSIAVAARDWRQVPDPGSCSSTALWNSALAAHGEAAATRTRHVAVYFPERADCGGWAGKGTIGGGSIWINGVPTVDVLAHELGHNFGIGHANAAVCTAGSVRVPLSDVCQIKAYADTADVMGFGMDMASGNLNTALADFLGLAQVVPVSRLPMTVDLAELSAVGSTRALKLTTSHGTVYVDFRPAVGRDVREPDWAGVQVHRVAGGGYPESHLLDMQPRRSVPFQAASLPAGTSWDIPGTGQTLTVTAVGATSARLSVASTVVTKMAVAPSGGTASVTPVFRFWSPRFGNAHFFTSDADEASRIRATDSNWVDEGAAFWTFATSGGTCTNGTVPVHRFYSAAMQSHFFTSDVAERDAIVATDRTWSLEGVAYCATTTAQTGTTALYRFWSPVFGKHHYTASAAEARQLDVGDPNWNAEGVAFYVTP